MELLQLGDGHEEDYEGEEEGLETERGGSEAGVGVVLHSVRDVAAPLLASSPSLSTSISTSWGPHQLATAHTLFGRSASATPVAAAAAAGSERRRWTSVLKGKRDSHCAEGSGKEKKKEEELEKRRNGSGRSAGDIERGKEEGEAGVDEERSSSVELSLL